MSIRRWICALSFSCLLLAGCGDDEVEPLGPGEETEQELDDTGGDVERELSGASAEVEAAAETFAEELDEGPIDALEAADEAGDRAELEAEREQAQIH